MRGGRNHRPIRRHRRWRATWAWPMLVAWMGCATLGDRGKALVPTRNPVVVAIFSLLVMTTGSPEGGLAPRDDLTLLLMGVEAFLGIALTGLLGFVLGNRIRR